MTKHLKEILYDIISQSEKTEFKYVLCNDLNHSISDKNIKDLIDENMIKTLLVSNQDNGSKSVRIITPKNQNFTFESEIYSEYIIRLKLDKLLCDI